MAFLFSFGFLATILEIHLATFDLDHVFIALCFVLQSAVYLLLSITSGDILKGIDEGYIMVAGAICLGIGYLMLGPCSYIFPNSLVVVILALPIMSMGQTFTYSNR